MVEYDLDRIEGLLTSTIKSALEGEDNACLSYSGGLDCSVIAVIASKLKNIQLCVVGTSDSQDVQAAVSGAEILDLKLDKLIITESDVEQAVPDLIDILKTRNALEISIELSLYFVCKFAKTKLIITGQGADELFGGYSRYTRMEIRDREIKMKQDVADYLQYNLPQEERLGSVFEKKVFMPYLNPSFIAYIEMLPMDMKVRKMERKYVLKLLGRKLGLPTEIVDRPKKAVQYGSGILNILKTLAKREGLEIHEYLQKI